MLVSPCLEQQPKGKEEQRKRRRGECAVRELTLDRAAVGGGGASRGQRQPEVEVHQSSQAFSAKQCQCPHEDTGTRHYSFF